MPALAADSKERTDQPRVTRRPWWAVALTIVSGLFLMGFGTAISLIRDERVGSVILILAGAAVAIIGLLLTQWTAAASPAGRKAREKGGQVEEKAQQRLQEQAHVTHAVPEGAAETEADTVAGRRESAIPVSEATSPAPHAEVERESPLPLTDAGTPDDVIIRTQARIPETDPFLGIPVQLQEPAATPKHRLVVLGDALSLGFQSLAMYRKDHFYPAMIARELGCYDAFRQPEFLAFGGLPLNLEYVVREMELRLGREGNWWEKGSAAFYVDDLLSRICDYWQDAPAGVIPETSNITHNLALPGADLADIMTLTVDTVRERLAHDEGFRVREVVRKGGLLLAHRILATARDPNTKRPLTAVQAASELGNQGGIETLIVFVGFGNALGSILDLQPIWSGDDFRDPAAKSRYNVWRPRHFEHELRKLAMQVHSVAARHVIWATVPHVTILPIARGLGGKTRSNSRYFRRYTRPWIRTDAGVSSEPSLSAAQARAIDSAIDQYNDAIVRSVREARHGGKDWLLLDVAAIFDKLATRRYGDEEGAGARPPWWDAYELPKQAASLAPVPDSRFFVAEPERKGGLFSLDGVHPTTTGHAILAQAFIDVMVSVGVTFRSEQPAIDILRESARNSLISDPPRSITEDLQALAWLDQNLNWIGQLRRLL